MRITIESTDKIVALNGVPAHIWEGTTISGIPVVCFITLIAVPDGQPTEQFKKEFQEHRCPRPELGGAFDARMVL